MRYTLVLFLALLSLSCWRKSADNPLSVPVDTTAHEFSDTTYLARMPFQYITDSVRISRTDSGLSVRAYGTCNGKCFFDLHVAHDSVGTFDVDSIAGYPVGAQNFAGESVNGNVTYPRSYGWLSNRGSVTIVSDSPLLLRLDIILGDNTDSRTDRAHWWGTIRE